MVLTDTTYFPQGSSIVKNTETCLSRDTSKAKPDRDRVGWGGLAQCLTAALITPFSAVSFAPSLLTAQIRTRIIHFRNHWFAADPM